MRVCDNDESARGLVQGPEFNLSVTGEEVIEADHQLAFRGGNDNWQNTLGRDWHKRKESEGCRDSSGFALPDLEGEQQHMAAVQYVVDFSNKQVCKHVSVCQRLASCTLYVCPCFIFTQVPLGQATNLGMSNVHSIQQPHSTTTGPCKPKSCGIKE